MTARGRARLVLGAAFVLGGLVGALAIGALGQFRAGRVARLGDPDGFVRHMEAIIEPSDAAQRDLIRPILEATARRNDEIRRASGDDMRAALEAMVREVAEHLDAEQLGRLENFARHPPPAPGGPGGRRPPPKRPR